MRLLLFVLALALDGQCTTAQTVLPPFAITAPRACTFVQSVSPPTGSVLPFNANFSVTVGFALATALHNGSISLPLGSWTVQNWTSAVLNGRSPLVLQSSVAALKFMPLSIRAPAPDHRQLEAVFFLDAALYTLHNASHLVLVLDSSLHDAASGRPLPLYNAALFNAPSSTCPELAAREPVSLPVCDGDGYAPILSNGPGAATPNMTVSVVLPATQGYVLTAAGPPAYSEDSGHITFGYNFAGAATDYSLRLNMSSVVVGGQVYVVREPALLSAVELVVHISTPTMMYRIDEAMAVVIPAREVVQEYAVKEAAPACTEYATSVWSVFGGYWELAQSGGLNYTTDGFSVDLTNHPYLVTMSANDLIRYGVIAGCIAVSTTFKT
jgi:hypothetical protein